MYPYIAEVTAIIKGLLTLQGTDHLGANHSSCGDGDPMNTCLVLRHSISKWPYFFFSLSLSCTEQWQLLQDQCKLFSSYLHLNPKVISSILPFHETAAGKVPHKDNSQLFENGVHPLQALCELFFFVLVQLMFGCEHFDINLLGFVVKAFSWSSLKHPSGLYPSFKNSESPNVSSKRSSSLVSMFKPSEHYI